MLDLKQLVYFVQIADSGGLSKAALELQVSHSALSREIQAVETELGHRLFHRTGRGMKLTEFGGQLLPRARQAVLDFSRFTHDALALSGRLTGTVRIALPGSIAGRIVAPVIRAARKDCPDLSLRFVEAFSGGVQELLAARRIDVGLFYTSKQDTRRGDSALAVSRLHLIGPAGDRLTSKSSVSLSQVAECPLLLPSGPHAVRAMLHEACAVSGLQLRVVCEVDSLLGLKEAVATGAGYTVSARDAVAPEIAAGRLQATLIRDPPLTRRLVMTLGPKHSITAASRAVAILIANVAKALVQSGAWESPRRP